jgi:hypothetical protein
MNGNSFIALLLHTPLRFLLGDTMLITVTGRVTGKPYSTPVGFYEEGGCLWVLSKRERTWWRNLRGGAPVTLYLRGRTRQGFGEAILDESSFTPLIESYLRAVPMAARPLGARMQDGKIHPEDAGRLAAERLFIRIRL